jgi:hypothetical protein
MGKTMTMIDCVPATAGRRSGYAFPPMADAMDREAARRLLLDLRERLDYVTATVISLANALDEPPGAVAEVAFWHFNAGQLIGTGMAELAKPAIPGDGRRARAGSGIPPAGAISGSPCIAMYPPRETIIVRSI